MDNAVAETTGLNTEDVTTLIEAVDAWVNKDRAGEMMSDLLLAVITDKNDPQAQATLQREREIRMQKERIERQLAEETAVLLKGKLIALRRALMSRPA